MASDILGGFLDTWDDANEDIVRWAQKLMDGFRYKENWHFTLTRAPEVGGVMLRIDVLVPDSRFPRYQVTPCRACGEESPPHIPITGSYGISRHLMDARDPEMAFWKFLRKCIQDVELHEVDEWFRVGGDLMWDPHKPPTLAAHL